MADLPVSIRLFLGVPGAGKTLAMQDYVRAHASEWAFFVVDRAGEWGPDNVRRWRGEPPPCFDVPHGSLDKVSKSLLGCAPGVYLFGHPWEGDEVAQVAAAVGNVVYTDDELDLVATYSGWTQNALRSMCHRGRHLPNMLGVPCELHILGAARCPQNLHTDVTSLCDECLVFRVQGEQTIARLVREGILREGDIERARTQPIFEYLLWRSTGEHSAGKLAPF